MTLSVILPCLEKDDRTCRLIAEIKRQSEKSEIALDLIVIEGVSPCPKARNLALSRAKGDYIAWVDSDDEILPDWFSSIAEALKGRPDVIVFPWIDEELGHTIFPSRHNLSNGKRLISAVLRDTAPGSYLWNKVIKREFWIGRTFNESYRLLTDFDILPHVLESVTTVTRLGKPLYRYRYEPKSVCRGDFSDRTRQLFEIAKRRLIAWEATPFVGDAIVPLAKQSSYRLSEILTRGDSPQNDDLLLQVSPLLRKHVLRLLVCRNLWIGDRVRVLALVSGQSWTLKAVHAIHSVFCG